MSERWIKLTHELARKPEVFSLARTLEQKQQTVLGCLFLLWMWFDEQTTDGFLPEMTATDADTVVGVTGFADAAEGIGWLECCNDGLRMPSFDEHTSQSAKKRASEARRKRVARKDGQLSVPDRTTNGQKADQRRGEKKRKTTGPVDAGPGDLETSETQEQSQPWTGLILRALKIQTTTRQESLPGPDSQRRCWTKSCGWDDRFIAELASVDPSTHSAAIGSVLVWFRRQLSAPDPIVPEPTKAAATAVLAVAMEAAKRPGLDTRVGWFRATLSKVETDRLDEDSKHIRTAANFVKSQAQKGTT